MNVDKIYPHEEVITMEYRFDGNDISKCGLIHKKLMFLEIGQAMSCRKDFNVYVWIKGMDSIQLTNYF